MALLPLYSPTALNFSGFEVRCSWIPRCSTRFLDPPIIEGAIVELLLMGNISFLLQFLAVLCWKFLSSWRSWRARTNFSWNQTGQMSLWLVRSRWLLLDDCSIEAIVTGRTRNAHINKRFFDTKAISGTACVYFDDVWWLQVITATNGSHSRLFWSRLGLIERAAMDTSNRHDGHPVRNRSKATKSTTERDTRSRPHVLEQLVPTPPSFFLSLFLLVSSFRPSSSLAPISRSFLVLLGKASFFVPLCPFPFYLSALLIHRQPLD